MSDIKDIIPEKDWRKVKIQDYPEIPTPQNVPSEHFFNGLSSAVKNLEFLSKPTNWVVIPLVTGVSTTYAPRVRKFGNIVELNGVVIFGFGSGGSYVHVATIPESFRPNRTIRFTSGSRGVMILVQILPDGKVEASNQSGTSFGEWFSVGCTYIID